MPRNASSSLPVKERNREVNSNVDTSSRMRQTVTQAELNEAQELIDANVIITDNVQEADGLGSVMNRLSS